MVFAILVCWSLRSVEGKFEMITIQTGLTRVDELRRASIGEVQGTLVAKWVKDKRSTSISFYADANTRNGLIAKLRMELSKCPNILTSNGNKAKPLWAIEESENETTISLIYSEQTNPVKFRSGC